MTRQKSDLYGCSVQCGRSGDKDQGVHRGQAPAKGTTPFSPHVQSCKWSRILFRKEVVLKAVLSNHCPIF